MTTKKIRPEPVITDHEVFRKIGEGSYGEVWLARAVTGTMRAVKVVYREDFDDEVGFEREFEGILRYEPISRDHPGLMNVLHVGRSENEGFYYYVMELGDDIHTGNEINPIEYEARTLRSDMTNAKGEALDIHFCLDAAERLAQALDHLHSGGLSHRDVKPANIIFVDGKAKLADIGLVAASGQRTFVGTEGFVPPEGPGSPQADVYSLGKVLYEMATGKDRLQFPELPDELPAGVNRKLWLLFNQIICDICDPKISQRTITNAGQLADAMQRLQDGKRLKKRRSANAKKSLLYGAGLLLLGLILWFPFWSKMNTRGGVVERDLNQITEPEKVETVEVPKTSVVTINTNPSGAMVLDDLDNVIGYTPLVEEMLVGTEFTYRFEREGFRGVEKSFIVTESGYFDQVLKLDIYRPPVDGQPWSDTLNQIYQPRENHHVSNFLKASHWLKYKKKSGAKTGKHKLIDYSIFGIEHEIVLTTQSDAKAFCSWLTDLGRTEGHLSEHHYIIPKRELEFSADGYNSRDMKDGLRPFHCVVKLIPYASLEIVTDPPGADVFIKGEMRGVTPCVVENLKPGWLKVTVSLEGYERKNKGFVIKDNEYRPLKFILGPNHGVVFGRLWENGLKQTLLPVGDLMVSAHEVRVSDYKEFENEKNVTRPQSAGFSQEENHPVVGVTKDDAMQFCQWLTKREREEQLIATNHFYRLPTDQEWSLIAGLDEEIGETTADRAKNSSSDPILSNIYGWGKDWTIDENSVRFGNIADLSASRSSVMSITEVVKEYDDGYLYTAPVGSFEPNIHGLYDISGNVQEWVEDDYNKTGKFEVVRGGGWKTHLKSHLRLIHREVFISGHHGNDVGFRIVLVRGKVQEEEEASE